MASKDIQPPGFATLARLKTFLRRGRMDYDWVAGRVYAACYNDPYVMQKILAAQPEDVQSSEAEEGFSGDADSDVSEDELEEEDDPQPEGLTAGNDGSKNNPVILDEETSADDALTQGNKAKRKRSASGVADEPAEKKSKSRNELVLCLNCGSKFNPKKNKEGACRYHPEETVLGELELNPTSDQISDDEDSRETWANAFEWACCEANFEDDAPCEQGRHRAEGDQTECSRRKHQGRRRVRYFG